MRAPLLVLFERIRASDQLFRYIAQAIYEARVLFALGRERS